MAELNGLRDLFIDELRDVYDAEQQIVKALPGIIGAASSSQLAASLDEHLEVTRMQVTRLEQIFKELEVKPAATHCSGMEGILAEGQKLIAAVDKGDVLDAGIIAAAQRVEHYEISVYGTLAAWSRQLGQDTVTDLLEETLEEEKTADEQLTSLAEDETNQAALGDDSPGIRA